MPWCSAFTVIVSLVTGIVFGLVPAWQASHVDLNSSLKSGSRVGSDGEHKGRLRNGLVMAEVALALVLLISAGLLIQSFARLGRVQPGIRKERLLTARIQLPEVGYPKNENIIAFFDQFLPRVRTLPGVEYASVIVPLPLSGSNMVTSFDMEEHPLPEGQRNGAPVRIIATDYFKTMGIPVRQGRVFNETRSLRIAAGRDRERALRAEIFSGSERYRKTDQTGLCGRRQRRKDARDHCRCRQCETSRA